MDTATIPLTTVFTPPPSCSQSWTYEGQTYNSVLGGLLMQNVIAARFDTSCWPSPFSNHGREPSALVYSPGACPAGYSTPVVQQGGATTTAICCQSGYSYSTTLTIINGVTADSVIFEGCISTLASGSATRVSARSLDDALNLTVVTGPMTMWGQPVTVEYQSSDMSLFTTSISSTTSATSAAAVASATVPPTAVSSPLASNTGLSGGATAGIVVGAIAAVIGLVALVFFLFRRRRQSRNLSWQGPQPIPQPEKSHEEPIGVYRPEEQPPGELMGQELQELETRPNEMAA